MRRLSVLITAFLAFANGAIAGSVDWQGVRGAGLAKLAESNAPALVPETPFLNEAGEETTLADWKGKVLLVNFWATWCAPCREEMPSLQALQSAVGGDDFAVLTIASGRNPPAAIDRFFGEIGVTDLPKLRDEKQALARAMGVLGLPVSVLVDREGREVARLIGDADWSSDAAKSLIAQLTAP